MADNQSLHGVWAVLKEIKQELKAVDDKWEQHIQDAAVDRNRLELISVKVNNIEKILTHGNGQESLVVQIKGLKKDVHHLKEATGTVGTIEERKLAETDARKAKWVVFAKLVGLASLAAPGVLAFLGIGGG